MMIKLLWSKEWGIGITHIFKNMSYVGRITGDRVILSFV